MYYSRKVVLLCGHFAPVRALLPYRKPPSEAITTVPMLYGTSIYTIPVSFNFFC